MKNKIQIGDIWYDTIGDKIREVVGFSYDHLGQPMALFTPVKLKRKKLLHFGVTCWVVFDRFILLEESQPANSEGV